jgi:ADP-heptose:LPS heptosyltransferase
MKQTTTDIMIFRFSAMGDIAMTVPVVKTLIAQNPGIEIIFVSRPFFAPLFKDIPQVKFVGIDLNCYKGLYGLWRLFRKLKSYHPDYIADLHDVLRSKILRIFFKLNAYKIAVIDKGRREKKALTRPKDKIFKALKSTHERYADVFRSLGYDVDLQLFNPEKPSLNESVKLFFQNFTGKKLVGIAPFAAHQGKQYPIEQIKELITLLLEKDANTDILLFGGGKKEKLQLDELEKINRNRIVNLAGVFNFEEELQIISRLNVMLSMDSANGHLAALYGVPVITVWGVTHPYAGFTPLNQPIENQIVPDIKKFPQLPTSVYGNKTFDGFERIWETVDAKIISEKIINLLY